MGQRILGMMGPGQGPMVFTRNLGERPRAHVTGLLEGEVWIWSYDSDGKRQEGHKIAANGYHDLKPSMYMSIVCAQGNPHMICNLLSGASRAVHST